MRPILVLILLSGCSFLIARPNPRHRGAERTCSSYVVPSLDLAASSALVFVGVMDFLFGNTDACNDDYEGCKAERRRNLALSLTSAGIMLGSSVYGYTAITMCGRRLDEDSAVISR